MTCHFAAADLSGANVTSFGVPVSMTAPGGDHYALPAAVPLTANVSLVGGQTYDLRVYCAGGDPAGGSDAGYVLGGSITAVAYPA
jgi:hypothetical protein